MQVIDAAAVREHLGWADLIHHLREMFVQGCESPPRLHYKVSDHGVRSGTLLVMPAWLPGKYIGLKMANVFPSNQDLGIPAVSSAYLLADGNTGAILAQIDGGELTARRTAAASVLAASFLARPDASTLVILGTGRVSRNLAEAYCATRPIRRVLIHGRDPQRSAAMARELALKCAADFSVANGLEAALAEADIVSSATMAVDPLIRGDALPPGIHVDLVGGFRPHMREADNDAIRRCKVFVDTRVGVLTEAGDIMRPIAEGALSESDLAADLAELCQGKHPGRTSRDQVTLFKSVGASSEDLAAAIALCSRVGSLPQ